MTLKKEFGPLPSTSEIENVIVWLNKRSRPDLIVLQREYINCWTSSNQEVLGLGFNFLGKISFIFSRKLESKERGYITLVFSFFWSVNARERMAGGDHCSCKFVTGQEGFSAAHPHTFSYAFPHFIMRISF